MTTKKHITNYKPKLLSKNWLLLLGFMLFFGVANAWSIDNSNINGRVVNNSLPVEYALLGTDYVVTDFVTYANSASEVSPVIRKYSSYFGIVYTMGRIGGSLYSSAKLAKAEEAAFAESAAKASSSEITTEETATATTVTSTEEKVTATSTEETAPTTTAEETTASEGITTSPATKENVPDETTTTEIKDGSVVTTGRNLNFSQLIKTNLSKLGISDDIAKYVLAPNSKGGAYVFQGVSVEAKEIALADEILNLTNQRCIFPKNNLQAIEGFLEDGTAFTMKELESNFNSFATRINEMSSKIKADPNFQWTGAEGYLKVPFNSFTKTDGSIQVVSKQYVEQQFNAAIGRNAFTIKNDGTIKDITVSLQDGNNFKLDLSKLKP